MVTEITSEKRRPLGLFRNTGLSSMQSSCVGGAPGENFPTRLPRRFPPCERRSGVWRSVGRKACGDENAGVGDVRANRAARKSADDGAGRRLCP